MFSYRDLTNSASVNADDINVTEFNASSASIASANITSEVVTSSNITTLTCGVMSAGTANVTNLSASNATISSLTISSSISAPSASFTNLTFTNATGTSLTSTSISATNATLSSLASSFGTISTLTATSATATNLTVSSLFSGASASLTGDITVGGAIKKSSYTYTLPTKSITIAGIDDVQAVTFNSGYDSRSVLSVDVSNSITQTSGFTYYYNGVKYTGQATSNTKPSTTGMYYYYIDSASPATCQVTQNFTSDLIKTKVLVASGYWNNTNQDWVFLCDERHGHLMDGDTHYLIHSTEGTKYISGLALSNFTISDGSLNSHYQFTSNEGTILDEDYAHTITAKTLTGTMYVFYLTSSNTWNRIQSDTCATTTGTGRLAYNKLTTGTWSLAEVTNNNFVLGHVLAINDGRSDNRLICLLGQNEYNTLATARAGAQTEINSIITAGLPMPEIVIVGTIVLQTSNSYTNTKKAKIVYADTNNSNYISWLGKSITSSATVQNHNNLSGLQGGQTTEYYHLTATQLAGIDYIDQAQTISGQKTFSALTYFPNNGIVTAKCDATTSNSTTCNATTANFTTCNGTTANFTTCNGTTGNFTNLSATSGTISTLYCPTMYGTTSQVTNLNCTSGTISSLTAPSFNCTTANVTNMTVGSLTCSGTIDMKVYPANLVTTDTIQTINGNKSFITDVGETKINRLMCTDGTMASLHCNSITSIITNPQVPLTFQDFNSGTQLSVGTSGVSISTLAGTSSSFTTSSATNLTATSGSIGTLTSTTAGITTCSIGSLTSTNSNVTNSSISSLTCSSAGISTLVLGSLYNGLQQLYLPATSGTLAKLTDIPAPPDLSHVLYNNATNSVSANYTFGNLTSSGLTATVSQLYSGTNACSLPATGGTLITSSALPDMSDVVYKSTEQTISGRKTFSSAPVITSIINVGTVFLPSSAGTLALTSQIPTDVCTLTTAQTVSAVKTFTSAPVISSITSGTATLTLPSASSGTLALTTCTNNMLTTDTAQTVSAVKTFTASPVISTITNTGTLTLPTTTGTLALTTCTNGMVNDSTNQSIGGIKTFSNTTEATNSTTAGTIVSGGLAVGKKCYIATDLNVGGNIIVGTSSTLSNANYTWNLPAKNGTLACLSDITTPSNMVTTDTTQTITGAKTFSNDVNLSTVGKTLMFKHDTVNRWSLALGGATAPTTGTGVAGDDLRLFSYFDDGSGSSLPNADAHMVFKRDGTAYLKYGTFTAMHTVDSTSTSTGAVVVSGGLGVGKDIYATNLRATANIFANGKIKTKLDSTGGGVIHHDFSNNAGIGRWGIGLYGTDAGSGTGTAGSTLTFWSYNDDGGWVSVPMQMTRAGQVYCNSTSDSNAPTNGSLIVSGGLGVKKVTCGGDEFRACVDPNTNTQNAGFGFFTTDGTKAKIRFGLEGANRNLVLWRYDDNGYFSGTDWTFERYTGNVQMNGVQYINNTTDARAPGGTACGALQVLGGMSCAKAFSMVNRKTWCGTIYDSGSNNTHYLDINFTVGSYYNIGGKIMTTSYWSSNLVGNHMYSEYFFSAGRDNTNSAGETQFIGDSRAGVQSSSVVPVWVWDSNTASRSRFKFTLGAYPNYGIHVVIECNLTSSDETSISFSLS